MSLEINISELLFDAFFVAAKPFWWLFVVVVFSAILKTRWFKGWLGEWLVNRTLAKIVDNNTGTSHRFNDVLLATPDGTTQIDHVLLTNKGLFVIETKNMKGWIFGTANQKRWTQQIYRHKSSFQNPLHQNYKHTQTLRALLDLDSSVVHSIVVFVGGVQFKTPMPANVIGRHELSSYIYGVQETVFTPSELLKLSDQLSQGKLESSFTASRNHIKHVREIKRTVKQPMSNDRPSEKKEVIVEPVAATQDITKCPRCNEALVIREAKKGPNKGNSFYGCSSFPKCRYTQIK
jgi:restriction system protein